MTAFGAYDAPAVAADPLPEAAAAPGWSASLALEYARDGERTVLARRAHVGPLVVQRPLYPEGPEVCQTIVVHPPAGIAGGDSLAIDVVAGAGARVQITTPGAARWYRSARATARQRVHVRIEPGATLEWLPQETIVFDSAIADIGFAAQLEDDAALIAWDVACLGRAASGERFTNGRLRQQTRIARDATPLFVERLALAGDDALMASPVGLNGASVFGTFVAAGANVPDATMTSCRSLFVADHEVAVTRMRSCLVARYRGGSAQRARSCFTALWGVLRPGLIGRPAVVPRIWNT
jgi:urease accessory protein